MAWPWKGSWHWAFPGKLPVTLLTSVPALSRSPLIPGQAPGLCFSVSTPQRLCGQTQMGSAEGQAQVGQGSLQVPAQP